MINNHYPICHHIPTSLPLSRHTGLLFQNTNLWGCRPLLTVSTADISVLNTLERLYIFTHMIPICQEVAKPHIFTILWWIGRVSLRDLYKEFLELWPTRYRLLHLTKDMRVPFQRVTNESNCTTLAKGKVPYPPDPSYAMFQESKPKL